MSPSTRSFGRSPATTCKSEASLATISSSRARRLIGEPEGATGCAGAPSEMSIIGPVIVPRLGLGAGFSDHLIDGGQSLQYLQPAVHSQRQHTLGDGGVANFRRSRALH